MTTSTSISSSDRGSGLSDFLARNLRGIVRLDAVVTTLTAFDMILFPALFVRLLGLGDTPLWAVRALGAEWLLFGLWLLSLWNKPLTNGMARFSIAVLAVNAVLILAAPAILGLGYSTLGWVITLGTVFFMDLVCFAWWQVLRGKADGAPASSRR